MTLAGKEFRIGEVLGFSTLFQLMFSFVTVDDHKLREFLTRAQVK